MAPSKQASTTTQAATGKALLTLAAKHVGEQYVLGVLVPKDNPNWTGPWDCAEFISWVVFQVSGTLYGCNRDFGDPSTADAYTGYWSRDASTLGTIVSLDQAARTPGACVLRIPPPGSIGHVVFSDGTGGTIEAHGHADGVIRSTLAGRRWDVGVLIPQINYTTTSANLPDLTPPQVFRLANPLMTGPRVLAIQTALKNKGFNPGVLDSQYGPHTHAAVVAFQLANGLVGDGEVGNITANLLGI